MSTYTKEQLIARINQVTAINKYRISRDPGADGLAMDNELLAIALASLEAEAVGYFGRFDADDEDLIDQCSPNISGAFPLYAAPPAPVSVPDERYQHLSQLYHAQEKRLFKLAQHIKGSAFDKYAHSPSQAIDVLESALFGESDDTSRAAMLQGADGNSPVIPDGWVLVPFEPTAEMISSGITSHFERSQIQIHDRPAPGLMECAYVAMLSAAPQQEVK